MVAIVQERFPVPVVHHGEVAVGYLAVRSEWDGIPDQLFRVNTAIERVVISCHGVGGNAEVYANRAIAAAADADATAETLVVAPQLITPDEIDDADDLGLEPSLLYWTSRRFNGGLSADEPYDRTVRISSYVALDRLLEHLTTSGLFPNLQTVVLVGHSGGGQLALRYCFASAFEPPEGIQLRHIPMNPGSVVYASPKRYRATGLQGEFVEPTDEMIEEATALSSSPNADVDDVRRDYDRFHYGLGRLDRYAYMAELDRETMRDRFHRRIVAYLIGTDDNDPATSSLPSGPRALLQGAHRLERSRRFEMHLRDEGLWDSYRHVRAEVEGVGHHGGDMMRSPEGLFYIFGYEEPAMPDTRYDPGEALLVEAHRILRQLEHRIRVRDRAAPGRARRVRRPLDWARRPR